MKELITLEDLRRNNGKRVRLVLPEEAEGVLSNADVLIDLDGYNICRATEFVVLYDKCSESGCTYCSIDEYNLREGLTVIELIGDTDENNVVEEKVDHKEELIEKIKQVVRKSYDSEMCGATSEWSCGNSDDVFNNGEEYGRSWLAYEIGCILGMKLEDPREQKYSWEE